MTDKTSTAPVCTDDVIRDWAERHDIFSAGSHLTDARAAFEDAASLTPPPDVVGGDVDLGQPIGYVVVDGDEPRFEPAGGVDGLSHGMHYLYTEVQARKLHAAPSLQGDAVVTALRECADVLREMRIAFPDPDRQVYRSASDALAKLDAALAAQSNGDGCPCEPSGSDGLSCPGKNGRLLCDPAHVVEQTRGDVIGWMLRDDQGGTYFDETCIWLDRPSAQEAADEMMDPDGDVYTPFPIVAGDVHIAPLQTVPDGWQLVPIEPTEEMIRKAWGSDTSTSDGNVKRVYAAMLFAAPSAGRMGVDRG